MKFAESCHAYWSATLLTAVLVIALPTTPIVAWDDLNPTLDEALLSQANVEPDQEGIGEFLEKLVRQARGDEADGLVADLGSKSFRQREVAMQKLMDLPLPPYEALQKALNSDDPEVRWRSRRVWDHLKQRPDTFAPQAEIFAALRIIQFQRLSGLTRQVLGIVPLVRKSPVEKALDEAMWATATPADLPLLREKFKTGDIRTRIAAMHGIAAVVEEFPIEWLQLAHDPRQRPELRMALATELLRRGERAGLKVLIDMLGTNSRECQNLLMQWTGNSFAINTDPRVADAMLQSRWLEWWQNNGQIRRFGPEPKIGWRDFLQSYLVEGSYGGQQTQFAKGLPASLTKLLRRTTKTANTINSVDSRHGTSPWLYPKRGQNEAPRVLEDDGDFLFPLWGTWRQDWVGWRFLDENGNVIQANGQGRVHLRTAVDFVRLKQHLEP